MATGITGVGNQTIPNIPPVNVPETKVSGMNNQIEKTANTPQQPDGSTNQNDFRSEVLKSELNKKLPIQLTQNLDGLQGDVRGNEDKGYRTLIRNTKRAFFPSSVAALKNELNGLSESQLKDKINSLVSFETRAVGKGGRTFVDVTQLTNFLENVSKLPSDSEGTKLKTRVFAAATSPLEKIAEYSPIDIQRVNAGLTKLLDTNTTGIITKLDQNDVNYKITNGKDALKTYLVSMIKYGEGKVDGNGVGSLESLGTQIDKLLRGNNRKEDPSKRFAKEAIGTYGKPYHQNARTLGFYAGTLKAAVESIKSDRSSQANTLKNIFSVVTGVTGIYNPVAGVVGGGSINEFIDSTVNNSNSNIDAFADTLKALTIPKGYVGEARTTYDAVYGANR